MVPEPHPSVVVDERGFARLVAAVVEGHRTIAPTVRDGTIVLAEISSPDDIASGVTLEQAPGSCRLVELAAGDRRRFAWAVGPHSAKDLQHPAERTLFVAELSTEGFSVVPPGAEPRTGPDVSGDGSDDAPLAIIGLRPCDLAAVGVLDRVLVTGERGSGAMGGLDPLVVVVNCAEPGGTCFCVSMGTGPSLRADAAHGADVVVWERGSPTGPEYLLAALSERGEAAVAATDSRAVTQGDLDWAESSTADAAAGMGRRLETAELAEALTATLDSERWEEIGSRCLSCGNCTMVCPTCFCSSVNDESSLDGSTVSRVQRWDSCFTLDHSFIHGGSVRSGTSDRYRQWLTHKLSTWWGQFGESGCVGCGRCISWCPVGIDLVEEADALLAEAQAAGVEAAGVETDAAEAPDGSVTAVLVRRREIASSVDEAGGRVT